MRLVLAVVCALSGMGFYLLTGFYPDVEWLQTSSVRVIWPALIVASVCILALLRPQYLKNDPVLVFWAGIGLAGCLLVAPLMVAKLQQADMDAAREKAFVELREELEQEQIRLAAIRRAEEMKALEALESASPKGDRFVQYEGRVPMDDLYQVRKLDHRMQELFQQQVSAYAIALEENPTKGPDEWVRFLRIEDLEEARTAHRILYEKTRAFTQFMESFEAAYAGDIDALEVSPAVRRIAVAELQRVIQEWDRTKTFELRTLDVQMLGAALKALNTLHSNWGKWSFDLRENQLTFENPVVEAAFSDSLLDMKAISDEVQQIGSMTGSP